MSREEAGRNGARSSHPQRESEGWKGRMGLTKREHIATAALAGFLAGRNNEGAHTGNYYAEGVAKSCVAYADALLEALETAP